MAIVTTINNAQSTEELFNNLQRFEVLQMGYYLHFPRNGETEFGYNNRRHIYNLPQILIDYYETHRELDYPPCAAYVFQNQSYLWLSDLFVNVDLKKSDRDVISYTLTQIADGLCIPLYGSKSNNGYMFLGLKYGKDRFEDTFAYQVQSLAQLIHLRFCLLMESKTEPVRLTRRETDVLNLISQGKTNPEIAADLSISKNTVSGYVAQVFLKLGVSDRVSAAMRAKTSTIIV